MIPKGTFGALGGALGGPAGAVIGQGISMITGYGRYTIKENSISRLSGNSEEFAKMGLPMQVPTFGPGAVRIQHREYIGDVVYTGESFKNTVFRLNPGSSASFPWLNAVGNSYQQWVPKGIVIYFESTCSEYTAQVGMGKVVIAANYNVNDPPYTDLLEMMNSQYAVSAKPSLSILHAVECAPNSMAYKRYYTAKDNVPINPVNDFCTVQVGVAGLPVGVPLLTGLGSLWVTYDIELTKPILAPQSNVLDVQWYTTATSTGLIFGNNSLNGGFVINPTLAVGSSRVDYGLTTITPTTILSITQRDIAGNPASALRFYKSGLYRIEWSTAGTGLASSVTYRTTDGPTACQNTAFVGPVWTGSGAYASWVATIPSGTSLTNYAEVNFDWTTAPTTITSFMLRITQIGAL